MFKDISRIPLTIKSILIDDDHEKWYVVENNIDLHHDFRFHKITLFDEEEEYEVKYVNINNKEDIIEYQFKFREDPDFKEGTVLNYKRPSWVQEIPDSSLKEIEYSTKQYVVDYTTTDVNFDLGEELTLRVDDKGLVTLKRNHSNNARVAQFNVGNERGSKLLADLLRCVSGIDCYEIELNELSSYDYDDDTHKEETKMIRYYFEDGIRLDYEGVYGYNRVNTESMIKEFIEECQHINTFLFDEAIEDEPPKRKKSKIDTLMEDAINEYNEEYSTTNDYVVELYIQKERVVDLLENILFLYNNIHHLPEDFNSYIVKIQLEKKKYLQDEGIPTINIGDITQSKTQKKRRPSRVKKEKMDHIEQIKQSNEQLKTYTTKTIRELGIITKSREEVQSLYHDCLMYYDKKYDDASNLEDLLEKAKELSILLNKEI